MTSHGLDERNALSDGCVHKQPAFYFITFMDSMINCAIDSVRKKELSIPRAAKAFGISYGTLWNRLRGKHTGKKGRPTHFSQDAEQQLADLAASCEKFGIALSKRIFLPLLRELQLPQVQ